MRIPGLLLPLLLVSPAFAQGVRFEGQVATGSAAAGSRASVSAVPFGKVTVCLDEGCNVPVAVYADREMRSELSQPLTADGRGQFSFWIAAGHYFYTTRSVSGDLLGMHPLILTGSAGMESSPAADAGIPDLPTKSGQAAGAGNTIRHPTITTSVEGEANSDAFQTGSGGNGVANAIAAGMTDVLVPPATTSIEAIGVPRGKVLPLPTLRYRGFGQDFLSSYNLLPSAAAQRYRDQLFAAGVNCGQDVYTGYSQAQCFTVNSSFYGAGHNAGSNGGYGWSVHQGFTVNTDLHASGIGQGLTVNHNWFGAGDGGNYLYCRHADGDPDSSAEGKVCLAVQGGSTGLVLSGRAKAIDAAKGLLTLGQSGQYQDLPIHTGVASDSGMIINTTHGGTPLHITGDDGRLLTTVEAVTPSSVCELTGNVGPQAGQEGAFQQLNPLGAVDGNGHLISYAVTARCSAGSLVAGKAIEMVCAAPSRPETIFPLGSVTHAGDTYTLNANLKYLHFAGACELYQGGTRGAIEWIVDRAQGIERNGGGNLIRTVYPVVGATDAHHLVYNFEFLGSPKSIPANQHNTGASATFNEVTRTGNIVTACGIGNVLGTISLGSLQRVTVRASGGSDASLNGTVTPNGYARGGTCVTYPQAGVNLARGSVKLSYGGTDAYGAAVLWPMVRPYKVFARQMDYGFVPSGQFGIRPNDELTNWAVGDTLEQTHNEGFHGFGVQSLHIANQVSTANSPSANIEVDDQGPGAINYSSSLSQQQYGSIVLNSIFADQTKMQGNGGQGHGPDSINIHGPRRDGIDFDDAPTVGAALSSGCEAPGWVRGQTFLDLSWQIDNGKYFTTRNCVESTITTVYYSKLPGSGYFKDMWTPAGRVLDAPIAFNGHTLDNIGTPTLGTQAATKAYVDAAVASVGRGATPGGTALVVRIGAQGSAGANAAGYLSGVTGAIGGSALAAYATSTGRAAVPGALKGEPCLAVAASGAIAPAGLKIDCAITVNGTATVQVTALVALTPAASTYNVRVFP